MHAGRGRQALVTRSPPAQYAWVVGSAIIAVNASIAYLLGFASIPELWGHIACSLRNQRGFAVDLGKEFRRRAPPSEAERKILFGQTAKSVRERSG